jgi:hypothetical protein
MILLTDTGGAGVVANPFIAFDDSGSVRQGYVGFGNIANADLYVNADIGDIRLIAGGGQIRLQDQTIITGACSATSFSGIGSSLTALTAANISTGSLASGVNQFFTASSTSNAYKIPFMNYTGTSSTNASMLHETAATFTYNPNINVLTVPVVSAGLFSGGSVTATGLITAAAVIETGDSFRIDFASNEETWLSAAANAGVEISHNNVAVLFTLDTTAAGVTSGAEILDTNSTRQDVGFNTLPNFNFNASDTLESSHCGHVTGKDNTTTTYKLTGPTSGNVDFPVGGVATIVNLGTTGNYTLEDTGTCTMRYCDGTAAPVDIALNGTLEPGGVITLWRYSTTAIYIFGSGFTP